MGLLNHSPLADLYTPGDVVHWSTRVEAGVPVLKRLVVQSKEPGTYHVLRIHTDGVMTVEVWRIGQVSETGWELARTYEPGADELAGYLDAFERERARVAGPESAS